VVDQRFGGNSGVGIVIRFRAPTAETGEDHVDHSAKIDIRGKVGGGETGTVSNGIAGPPLLSHQRALALTLVRGILRSDFQTMRSGE